MLQVPLVLLASVDPQVQQVQQVRAYLEQRAQRAQQVQQELTVPPERQELVYLERQVLTELLVLQVQV